MADPCEKCGGSGWIIVDDATRRKCICAYAKELRQHLGEDIATAPTLKHSPLYVPDKSDLTLSNLFIRSYWQDLLPHLKWALTFKTPAFKFIQVTDEKLKTVYVGAESYVARAKGTRDDVSTFNSLADLVGRQFNLVIIRLGFLGYRNQAMPGILKEALLLRESLNLATWIVEEPNSIFGPGHRSFSDEVQKYIREHFEVLQIRGEERVLPARGIEQPKKPRQKAIEDVSLDDFVDEDSSVSQPEPAFKDADWSIVGGDEYRPKKPNRNFTRKRPSGGGPI